MNTRAQNSFEIPAAATAPDSQLEGIRDLVDKAYADIPDIEELEFELVAPPATAVRLVEGEAVDSARRKRIAEADQAVANAFETEAIPKPEPSQFEQLYLG